MPHPQHAPKLSLVDCVTIQREIKNGIRVAALARRYGVSQTLIYQVQKGTHPSQVAARRMGVVLPDESVPHDGTLCPGCNLPTGQPCQVCRLRDSAAKTPV